MKSLVVKPTMVGPSARPLFFYIRRLIYEPSGDPNQCNVQEPPRVIDNFSICDSAAILWLAGHRIRDSSSMTCCLMFSHWLNSGAFSPLRPTRTQPQFRCRRRVEQFRSWRLPTSMTPDICAANSGSICVEPCVRDGECTKP